MNATAQIDLSSVLARSGDVVYSDVAGDVAMMSVQSGRYFGLANVGARIWALLDQPISVGAICDRLMTEYRVNREICEREVLAFARRMAEEGVVTVAPADTERT